MDDGFDIKGLLVLVGDGGDGGLATAVLVDRKPELKFDFFSPAVGWKGVLEVENGDDVTLPLPVSPLAVVLAVVTFKSPAASTASSVFFLANAARVPIAAESTATPGTANCEISTLTSPGLYAALEKESPATL